MFDQLGLLALFVVLIPSLVALAATRYFIARAFGIPDIRFFFGSGPNTSLEGISPWARPAIVLGCAATTYMLPASLFFAVNCIAGQTTAGSIVIVLDSRPAAEAGMKTGDRVAAIGGRKIEDWDELASTVRAHPGEPLDVTVDREGREMHFIVTPGARGEQNEGRIGVSPKMVPMGIGEALVGGFASPATTIMDTAQGMIKIMRGVEVEVAGPAKIAEIAANSPHPIGALLYSLAAVNAYFWPGFVLVCFFLLPRRRKAPLDGRAAQ